MKRLSAQEVIDLYKSLESQRDIHLKEWENIAIYVRPAMRGFFGDSAATNQTSRAYDSTAIAANSDLAKFLAGSLTPEGIEWVGIEFSDEELNEQDAVQEWLEDATKAVRKALARSNFYAEAKEFYDNIGSFSTAPFECTERYVHGKYVGPLFENVWLRDIVAMADQNGDLTIVIRRYERTASQWFAQFGDEIGPEVRRLAMEKPDELVCVYHAVYPQDDRNIDPDALQGKPADKMRMPFASTWVNGTDKSIIRDGGLYMNSIPVPRFATRTGTVYGTGPAQEVMADVLTLNEAKRIELRAWEQSIQPPLAIPDAWDIETLDLSSAAVNKVPDPNGIREIYGGSDFRVSVIKTEEARQAIRTAFFADLIREPGEPRSGTTAYEIAKRMERAQRILGEAVVRIREEFVRPVVEHTFWQLYRHDMLPPLPRGITEAEVHVRFSTPIQIVQELQRVEAMQMFMAELAQTAAIQNPGDPSQAEVLDLVDFDAVVREQAERRGITAKVMRSKEEAEAERERRREDKRMAQQMAMAQAAAGTLRDLNQVAPDQVQAGINSVQ